MMAIFVSEEGWYFKKHDKITSMNELIKISTEEEIGDLQEEPSTESEKKSREWWEYRLSETNSVSKEQIRYAREFYEFAASKDTRLVAMVILGSTLKGYANEDSDIDVSLILKEEREGTGALDHCRQLEREFRKKRNGRFKIHTVDNIDIRLIDEIVLKPKIAEILVMPGIGQIEKIREKVRFLLTQLSEEEKRIWINDVLKERIRKDLNTDRKILLRKKIDISQLEDYKESRKKLYRQKILRIFFPNETL